MLIEKFVDVFQFAHELHAFQVGFALGESARTGQKIVEQFIYRFEFHSNITNVSSSIFSFVNSFPIFFTTASTLSTYQE